MTVSPELLAVAGSVFFVVLLELIRISRSMPTDLHISTRKGWEFAEYDYRSEKIEKRIMRILVPSGRENAGIFRVGLLNFFIEYILSLSIAVLFLVGGERALFGLTTDVTIVVVTMLVVLLVVLWLFLPIFTIKIYDDILRNGIIPFSIVYHVIGVGCIVSLICIETVYLYPALGGVEALEQNFISNFVFLSTFAVGPFFIYAIKASAYKGQLKAEIASVRNSGPSWAS